MSRPMIASVAKQLLFRASQRLGTADPNPDVRGFLDESLAIPVGDSAIAGSRLLEPSFSETTRRTSPLPSAAIRTSVRRIACSCRPRRSPG